jgi:hypothetical protein
MNDVPIDQTNEAAHSDQVSDEVLEAAAEEASKNPTLMLSGYACPW